MLWGGTPLLCVRDGIGFEESHEFGTRICGVRGGLEDWDVKICVRKICPTTMWPWGRQKTVPTAWRFSECAVHYLGERMKLKMGVEWAVDGWRFCRGVVGLYFHLEVVFLRRDLCCFVILPTNLDCLHTGQVYCKKTRLQVTGKSPTFFFCQ